MNQRNVLVVKDDNTHKEVKLAAVDKEMSMTEFGTELLRRALELNLSDELVYPVLIEQAKQQGKTPADYLRELVTEKMG